MLEIDCRYGRIWHKFAVGFAARKALKRREEVARAEIGLPEELILERVLVKCRVVDGGGRAPQMRPDHQQRHQRAGAGENAVIPTRAPIWFSPAGRPSGATP